MTQATGFSNLNYQYYFEINNQAVHMTFIVTYISDNTWHLAPDPGLPPVFPFFYKNMWITNPPCVDVAWIVGQVHSTQFYKHAQSHYGLQSCVSKSLI